MNSMVMKRCPRFHSCNQNISAYLIRANILFKFFVERDKVYYFPEKVEWLNPIWIFRFEKIVTVGNP